MSDTVINVENLGKRYTLRHQAAPALFRDRIAQSLRAPLRWIAPKSREPSPAQEDFWALREVNFTIKRGEVVGIIGRNGAGKSTLLKILSRITEPTTGRVRIKGRVASLLEVGTGFHPELSGRENIFLNGAVLGMTRAEIRRKFDEIVAFAEVERFLDTPVKHYSSGMYVRLAFAVAAHLEPEILIVDEVLAVGDAAFQNKCLGKIDEVTKQHGRTVLIVSHNMESILRLCQSVIMLAHGRVSFIGVPAAGVAQYANLRVQQAHSIDCRLRERPGWVHGGIKLEQLDHLDSAAGPWTVPFAGVLELACSLTAHGVNGEWQVFFALFSASGIEVAAAQSAPLSVIHEGTLRLECQFSDFRLTPGSYFLNIGVRTEARMEDFVAEAARIEVLPTTDSLAQNVDAFRGFYVPKVNYRLQ